MHSVACPVCQLGSVWLFVPKLQEKKEPHPARACAILGLGLEDSMGRPWSCAWALGRSGTSQAKGIINVGGLCTQGLWGL